MAFKREKVVRAAEKYVGKGKIEAAIKEYMKVLAEFPNEAGTLNRVGDLYARIDKDDDAIRLFSQIAEQYSGEGFLVKAIAIYKKILRLDPARLAVYERLGGLYYRQGLVNEARGQFQVLADHYLKNSDAAAAINIYQRMSEMEPDNPSHHLKLAELYQQGQLWDQAMASYDAIAQLMLEHNRVEEALRVYQRAIEVYPQDIEFIRLAVQRLQTAGGPGPAAKLLASSVELNPAASTVVPTIESGPPEPPPEASVESELAVEAQLEHSVPVESSGSFQEVELVDELEGEALDPMVGLEDDSGVFELDLDLDLDIEAEDSQLPSIEVEASGGFSFDSGESSTETEPPVAMRTDIEGVAFEMAAEDTSEATNPDPSSAYAEVEASGEMEFDLDLDIDLEMESEFDLELELESEDAFDEVAGVPTVDLGGEPRTDPAEADIESVAEQVNPNDLIAEAEVFAKYGLASKASERVISILENHPKLLSARTLEINLAMESGETPGLADLAKSYRELTSDLSDPESWEKVKPKLEALGIWVTEEEVEVVEPVAPAPPEPKKERVSKLLEALEPPVVPKRRTPKLNIDAALAELSSGVKPSAKRSKPTLKRKAPPASDVDSLIALAGLDSVTKPKGRAPSVVQASSLDVQPPTQPDPPVESIPIESLDLIDQGLPSLDVLEPLDDSVVSSTSEVLPTETLAREPAPVETDEGSLAEAGTFAMPTLDEEGLDLELDGFKLPEEKPLESAPFDDSAMNWLDEIPAAPTSESSDGSLFDDEEDFFDLAAELEQELDEEEAASLDDIVSQPEEPSLKDIVDGFKRGVAENLSAEDYGTHYNLGIAYREMGLTDEAVGEFQLASKDPVHLVDCCSMLGVCFTEKGLFELAVKWYKRGLEAPDLLEETMLSLLYEMGEAYLSMGDEGSARKTFVELSGINIGYRDVIDRIEALGG